jgi:holliday junction DNA helicase RuvA
MIATLSGRITEILPDAVILEVSGIGYEVFTSAEELTKLTTGSSIQLYIYDHIREDLHNLYGFKALSTKQLFVQLLSVSGVGPKMAMQILSSGEARLRQAIASGNPALLKGVAGVGTKTAERVIVDLKDKLGSAKSGLAPITDETYQALVALGYSAAEATDSVSRLPADVTDPSERVKLALKQIKR